MDIDINPKIKGDSTTYSLDELKTKFNDLKETMNLGKKFPQIRPNAVRTFMVLLIILLCVAVYTDGTEIVWGVNYVYCPSSKLVHCDNPFYTTSPSLNPTCQKVPGLCSAKTIPPGVGYGHKPSEYLYNIWRYIALAFLVSFFLNMILYLRYKRLKNEDNH